MKVAITGASGLIGTALSARLSEGGHDVLRLVRRIAASPDELSWDPASGAVDLDRLADVDAVVHLAGAGVGDHRWTAAYKREILASRVAGTRTISRAMAQLAPRSRVLVSGSAIGFYGDTGDRVVDESAPSGDGFLPEVVRQWEAATEPAASAGVRVVCARSGLVVSSRGGAWGRMLPLFRLGLGGRLGPGTQYWSWVSLRDEVSALMFLIENPSISGPVNVTAPTPVTNAEVTAVMGAVLHRPTLLAVPAFALTGVLGEFSSEVLRSSRVVPRVLTEAGFPFQDTTLESALRFAVGAAA